MLKSPILLGNDLSAMSNATLGVLSNREVPLRQISFVDGKVSGFKRNV